MPQNSTALLHVYLPLGHVHRLCAPPGCKNAENAWLLRPCSLLGILFKFLVSLGFEDAWRRERGLEALAPFVHPILVRRKGRGRRLDFWATFSLKICTVSLVVPRRVPVPFGI
eukprot:2491326-Rhodomonas_salina.1